MHSLYEVDTAVLSNTETLTELSIWNSKNEISQYLLQNNEVGITSMIIPLSNGLFFVVVFFAPYDFPF